LQFQLIGCAMSVSTFKNNPVIKENQKATKKLAERRAEAEGREI
jgi:hypothetical protein